MSEITVRSFRVNIVAPIWPMNELKLRKLQSVFGTEFTFVAAADGQSLLLANSSKNLALILGPNQITLGMDGEQVVPDFKYMQDALEKIFETLLLEPKGRSGIQIVGNFPSENSSMDQSFGFLSINKNELDAIAKNLRGVGLRFLIDHGQDLWEFKFEPLIANSKYYFIEALCGSSNDLQLDEIIKNSEEAYTYFIGDWKKITEKFLERS